MKKNNSIGIGLNDRNALEKAIKIAELIRNNRSYSIGYSFESIPEPLQKNLGFGFSLIPLENENNTMKYSYLYKDGIKVSDTVFRLGGLSSGFNGNPYCMLLKYDGFKINEDFGCQCIIDKTGKVVVQGESFGTSFYYMSGVIAIVNNEYYNLLTQKPIVKSGQSISSDQFYFIENKYNKEYPIGVYKINKETGEYEIFN